MYINPLKRQDGMALITVLLLGLFGAAMVIGLFYISKNLLTLSGVGTRYMEELEEAKGIAHYLAATVMSSTRDLECGANGSKICIPNPVTDCNESSASHIFLPTNVYDASKHDATACYLFALDDPNAVEPYTLHGFWIKVTNPTSGERVEIDFVYKVK